MIMGHQYPLNQQQYQDERHFLNTNTVAAAATAASRHIYFDSIQSRPRPRVVQRRPHFYQQLSHPSAAYPTRVTQVLHSSPFVINRRPYGDPYCQSYDEPYIHQHKFMTTPQLSSYPSDQQHVQQMPTGYYDYEDGQVLSREPEKDNQLSAYYHNDFLGEQQQQQQQQQSPGEYLDGAYVQVPSYCEDGATSPTAQQHLQRQLITQRNRQNDQLGDEISPADCPPPSLQHHDQCRQQHQEQPQQPASIHHMSQQQSSANAANYFRYDPRARSTLSDEQTYQYSSGLQRPVQTILVQNPSPPASQMYYVQTNDNQFNLASSSSGDIIPSPNFPLRNRQDMVIDNGSTAASLYDSANGELLQAPTAVSDMNSPFEVNQFDMQHSSSMLSEASMITSPTAALSRGSLDMNETQVAILASNVGVDNGEIDGVQYGQNANSFNSVYKCNRARQPPGALKRLQRSEQPFTSSAGSSPSSATASHGKNLKKPLIVNAERKHQLAHPINDTPLHILSSPKTNHQEYLDMGTNGSISQDWLDTICGHLIEHMNNFGICVIDNFLGSIKGELILKEVHKLYSHGRYSKGRLVSNKLDEDDGETSSLSAPTKDDSSLLTKNNGDKMLTNAKRVTQQPPSQRMLQGSAADATGTIRNDRVIWVDGCEDGCAEINNLIQTLCSVVTNSSRLSLYSNNGLDKVNINKRTKAHVACYPGNGTRYIKHVDNPNGDGRVITAIYYLNKNWNTKRDGGLLRMFPTGMDEVANIEPLFDRALFFWSDRRNPHEVLPSFRDRFAITVWYIGESRPA